MLALAIFLGAFLLFEVQPIMGRYVLPWFGGGPTVWTTCMLFFQVLLVAGYGYAHRLGSLPKARLQGSVHVALLAFSLLFLPLDPRSLLSKAASSSDPSGRILFVLAASIGGPYLLLSSTGPLLQRWYHLIEPQQSPWRLYSLSNAASFLALLSYPFAVEPYLTLRTQFLIWSALYVAFVVVCGWIALTFKPAAAPTPTDAVGPTGRPRLRMVLFWSGLAAAGSVLLLATTNLICQDIAVIPFLWVAPLSIYLLTFVLAFESERWYQRTFFALAAGLFVPAGCVILVAAAALSTTWELGIYLGALFVTCMICHGELARARPSPEHLTAFYLSIASGGAVGGLFVALVSPRIFSEYSEYPIGLAAACLLGLIPWVRTGSLKRWNSLSITLRFPLMALVIAGITSLATAVINSHHPTVVRLRNFYGILRVTERTDAFDRTFRELTHGRIRHGIQYVAYPQSTWPTTYYGPHSGVGIVLNSLTGPQRRVAVVGLGAGTLAAWGHVGDRFRFYEINPTVAAVAGAWFTYLKDSKAQSEVVLGDARVELERELLRSDSPLFDVIAVDAFSSDAIPLHLLTAECGDIYRRHMAPGGLLLFHISNRSLRLDPVARGLAQHLGWRAVLFVSPTNSETGESQSSWVLVTANSAFLARPEIARAASPWSPDGPAPIIWTDDFASLWHVLRP
jgi:hypothetical protein